MIVEIAQMIVIFFGFHNSSKHSSIAQNFYTIFNNSSKEFKIAQIFADIRHQYVCI